LRLGGASELLPRCQSSHLFPVAALWDAIIASGTDLVGSRRTASVLVPTENSDQQLIFSIMAGDDAIPPTSTPTINFRDFHTDVKTN